MTTQPSLDQTVATASLLPSRTGSHLAGYLLIAVSAASFGAMAILGRFAYAAGANTGGVLL
ncbi:MAG: EamA/RhaT family transporter, partial [Pseudomonadota bacterium]